MSPHLLETLRKTFGHGHPPMPVKRVPPTDAPVWMLLRNAREKAQRLTTDAHLSPTGDIYELCDKIERQIRAGERVAPHDLMRLARLSSL